MAGRVVVITGVTRGLGRAMAEEFIRLGHTVLGCGRTKAEIDGLRRRFGKPHDFYRVDVASEDEVKSWASLLVSAHGAADLVLNNAAVINRRGLLWEISAREFSEVIDINLKGIANVVRHFVPEMVRRRQGVIVNLSSSWGQKAEAEIAPYCASKWAVEGLTLALAREVPTGLAVVAFNPGLVNTGMLQTALGSPANGYISPEDWAAKAVPFLLRLGPDENGQSLALPN